MPPFRRCQLSTSGVNKCQHYQRFDTIVSTFEILMSDNTFSKSNSYANNFHSSKKKREIMDVMEKE